MVFAGVLEVGAKLRGHPVAPLHIVYPWLQLLHLLADARWRKLDAAAPLEQVQQFLDVLQGHVAMLWVAHPHESHEETGTIPQSSITYTSPSQQLSAEAVCLSLDMVACGYGRGSTEFDSTQRLSAAVCEAWRPATDMLIRFSPEVSLLSSTCSRQVLPAA